MVSAKRTLSQAPIRILRDGRLAAIDYSILPDKPIIFDGTTTDEEQIIARLKYEEEHPDDYYSHFPKERRQVSAVENDSHPAEQEKILEAEITTQTEDMKAGLQQLPAETRERLTLIDVKPLQSVGQPTYKERFADTFEVVEELEPGSMYRVQHVIKRGLHLAKKSLNREGLEIALRRDPDAIIKAHRLMQEEVQDINEGLHGKIRRIPPFAIDATDDADKPHFYEQFYPGSVEEVIKSGLKPHNAIDLFLKMAEPIKDLHKEGHALMDIKPRNYRLDENGEPVLIDINSKRVNEAIRPEQSLILSGATDSGRPYGTPLYMAPEQEEGRVEKGKEHLVDVFQLSTILYENLTGMRPAGDRDHLTKFPALVQTFGNEQTKQLDELIQRNRSRDLTQRSQSVTELTEKVKTILNYKDENSQLIKYQAEVLELQYKTKTLEAQLKKAHSEQSTKQSTTLEEKAVQVETLEVAQEVTNIVWRGVKVVWRVVKTGASYSIGGVVAIPTMIRNLNNCIDDIPLSIWSGLMGIGGNTIMLGTLYRMDYPTKEFFLTTLATNALSGVYEIVRHAKNKVEERKREFAKERFPRILEAVKQRDFSLFIKGREHLSREEKSAMFAGEIALDFNYTLNYPLGERWAIKKVIRRGLAYDKYSALQVLEALTGRSFFTNVSGNIQTEPYVIRRTASKYWIGYKADRIKINEPRFT
ncbi:serine/threonine protein kinase [Candidatus Pacearchaeota archaeon]|nr:serine/threonine protein kinase [Candidatus Pacearchaeota archaeon]